MEGRDDAERLRRLQRVTDAALAHLRIDDLLATLLERTREVLAVDTCAFLLLDEDADELVARAALGLEEEVEQGVRIPLGRGFAGKVAAERRHVLIEDLDHADILNPLLREKRLKTLLGAPLVAQGKVVGVLHVGSLTPRYFEPADIELLQLVADRAAIAIENARLFEAQRRARERLEAVQAVTDVALGHLELDALLAELLERIHEILHVDTCAILLFDASTKELVARAAVGIEEEVERGVRIPLGRGFAGKVLAQERPIILDDVDHADVVNPILHEKGIKSLLGVPLAAHDEPIGVLHVGSLTPRRFTQDEVELLQLVAARVALAIAKARVHEEVVRLDQMKMDFVAVASHELRTPATAVYGAAATLRGRADTLSEEQKDELREVLWDQVDRLRRLIEQLLDLSRLDSNSIRIQPKRVRVRDALSASVRIAVGDSADVLIDASPDLEAELDPMALDRIVSNLVTNAVRHGDPPVIVSAEHSDHTLRIAVEDNGSGVPPAIQPELFGRFERGDEGHGSGLGLSIAKAYATAHGGDVVYEPSRGGARFEFVLPIR